MQKLKNSNHPELESEKEKESKANIESELITDKLFKKDALRMLSDINSQSTSNNYFIPNKIETNIALTDSLKFKSLMAYLENSNLIRFDSVLTNGQSRYKITNQGLMEAGKHFYEPID